ncbi:serine hydrolase domain-containing protein [Sphingomonas sp.]|uniref:serine hydrolase domain-containing protein n=1 Tax=Sphingomonas sp. TaxID=28214 RepID=UPI00286D5AE6|nr:serine hydrolase domain-containing protein [Sphingomonas sp.]
MKWFAGLTIGIAGLIGTIGFAQDRASLTSALVPQAAPAAAPATPAGLAQASAAPSLSKQDVDAWLDGYMPYALSSGDIPGAVVVVVKDGQIVTARGFGYADVDKRTPVDPDRTLFRPGSVSKLAIWTAVMQQVEQGKIGLDKDVNGYLDFKIPPFHGQPVTMRQLMTHTAGFEETAKGIIFYDHKHLLPLGDYLKRETPRRIYAPGTTPAYSNWGTALAGYIVQRTSGEDLNDYLDHHIFAPLGMRNSTFRQPLPANLKGQMALGYDKPGQPSLGFEIIGPWPAGSEAASGTDMGRFMIAHLQNGRGLLQPATAALMHNSPTSAVNPMSLIPPLNRMELGFFETNVNGREIIGHLGDTEAFHTSLHLFMKDGVGFYVSFNSPGKAGAAGTLRKAVFMDFADRYFPNIAPADGRVDAKTSAAHAQQLAGVWQASRRWETHYFSILNLLGQFKVGVDKHGGLVVPSLVGPNGRPQEWVEIAPFVWRDRTGHDRLAAKVADGKVVRWATDFFSPFEVFDPVPAGKSSAWILPVGGASALVLLLTVLAWPIGWWNRRRYKAEFALTGLALNAYRATRITSLAALAILVGWGVAFTLALTSAAYLTGSLDSLLWFLQIAGLVVFLALVAATMWNARLAFQKGNRWNRKLWAAVMVLAALILTYVAWTFGLFAMTVDY